MGIIIENKRRRKEVITNYLENRLELYQSRYYYLTKTIPSDVWTILDDPSHQYNGAYRTNVDIGTTDEDFVSLSDVKPLTDAFVWAEPLDDTTSVSADMTPFPVDDNEIKMSGMVTPIHAKEGDRITILHTDTSYGDIQCNIGFVPDWNLPDDPASVEYPSNVLCPSETTTQISLSSSEFYNGTSVVMEHKTITVDYADEAVSGTIDVDIDLDPVYTIGATRSADISFTIPYTEVGMLYIECGRANYYGSKSGVFIILDRETSDTSGLTLYTDEEPAEMTVRFLVFPHDVGDYRSSETISDRLDALEERLGLNNP